MKDITTAGDLQLLQRLEAASQDVGSSVESFCPTAGMGAIEQMLREDSEWLAGGRNSRDKGRIGHRWRGSRSKIDLHGGDVAVHRLRARSSTRGKRQTAL